MANNNFMVIFSLRKMTPKRVEPVRDPPIDIIENIARDIYSSKNMLCVTEMKQKTA